MALSARAEPDGSRSLGHARLVLRGVSPAAAAGGYRIRREGYQASNLGQRGWQVSEEVLRPVAVETAGDDTVFILGPRITRHMEPGPVHLVLPGLGEIGFFWPETIEVFDGELPLDPVIPAERPSQPPASNEDATRVLRPLPPSPAPPIPPPAAPPAASGGRAPVALWGALGLVLVLAAGGGVWWLRGSDEPPAAPLAAPPPATPPQAAPVVTPLPRPPQPQAAVWPDGTDDLSPRDVVGRAANAAAIFVVAQRRQGAGRHDDALVLFEEAAARGHAPAMTALGRLYDPIGFQPGRPFRTPDLRAAARQYTEAERAGDPAATPLRAALRAWLQQQVDAGQATAATTLREFW